MRPITTAYLFAISLSPPLPHYGGIPRVPPFIRDVDLLFELPPPLGDGK